jgi:hypothetical protein
MECASVMPGVEHSSLARGELGRLWRKLGADGQKNTLSADAADVVRKLDLRVLDHDRELSVALLL